MKKYKELQIIKHALQHYIKRDNVQQKDIEQEKRLLGEIENKVSKLKELYDIK